MVAGGRARVPLRRVAGARIPRAPRRRHRRHRGRRGAPARPPPASTAGASRLALALFATRGRPRLAAPARSATPGIARPRRRDGAVPVPPGPDERALRGRARALFLWTLALHLEWRAGRRARLGWVACGWALGLLAALRPRHASRSPPPCCACLRPRAARRSCARSSSSRGCSRCSATMPSSCSAQRGLGGWTGVQSGDLTPPLAEFALALLPALVLAATGWRRAPTPDPLGVRRRARGLGGGGGAIVRRIPLAHGEAVRDHPRPRACCCWRGSSRRRAALAPAGLALLPHLGLPALAGPPPVPGLVRAARLRHRGGVLSTTPAARARSRWRRATSAS